MQTLTDKTAIVTGAGSGIGAGIASVLSSEGATVMVADLDGERAAATAAKIDGEGGRSIAHVCDVSRDEDVKALVRATVDATGRVDILASNAGIYPIASIEETTEDLWDRVMTVNAKASWLLMRAVAPVMRRQHYGRIVVTSSVTGPKTAMAGLAHYAASKAALMGLVRTAALELGGDGVTVNAVLPGTVDTEGLRASAGGTGFFEVMLPSIPLGRVATPTDLGWAVRLLASDEAGYITGQGLIVDGGQSISEGGASNDQVAVLGNPA
jgi:3-oxoacyl-[acyl-carrier protein] reductase